MNRNIGEASRKFTISIQPTVLDIHLGLDIPRNLGSIDNG